MSGEHCCGHNLSEEELNAATVVIAAEKEKERRKQEEQAQLQDPAAQHAVELGMMVPNAQRRAAPAKAGRVNKKKEKGEFI